MKVIIVKPKFGGREYLLGLYSDQEADQKLKALEGKKIVVSMNFPKPVSTHEYSIVSLG